MGAPIQTQTFQTMGAAPSVIAYAEIYNAIQTGVIQAAENEALGVEQMKFYEVGPYISQTGMPSRCVRYVSAARPSADCRRTCRPRFSRLAKRPGSTAATSSPAKTAQRLEKLAKEGKVKLVDFTDREQLLASLPSR